MEAIGAPLTEAARVTRLLAYATEAVDTHAPMAPEVVANEAAVVLAGFLFDQLTIGRGPVDREKAGELEITYRRPLRGGYDDALRRSGAHAILAPHRRPNATTVREDDS